MIALIFMQHVIEGVQLLIEDINRPPDEDKLRIRFAREAVRFLNDNGGHLVDVHEIRASGEPTIKPSMIVSINYFVKTREDQCAGQHKTYTVDTTSWKSIRNDLNVLGKNFAEAINRAYKDDDKKGHDSILVEYSELLESINSKLETKPK